MNKPLIREEWMKACEFHDLTESQVLREVSRRVKEVKARATSEKSSHPLVLLDLDSTLYEVGPRTHQILREWMDAPQAREFGRVRETLSKLEPAKIGYSLGDTFASIGLDLGDSATQAALKSARAFWNDRFFTNEYLQHDHAYEGAPEFARELYELGAELVYLTGRDEPGMGEGTRQRLKQDGFPWAVPRTHLLTKATFEQDDLHHKQDAATYVREHGTLIASFENEPPNLVALQALFPEAMHVFVDTVCSEREAPASKGLYRIKGFVD